MWMIDFLMTLLLAFILGAAMPARWGLRVAPVLALPFAFLVFDATPYDSGAGDALGLFVFVDALMVVGAGALGAGVRAAVEVWRFGAIVPMGRDGPALKGLSFLGLALFGIWCAVPVFAKLSWHLAGIGSPMTAHALVGLAAIAFAVAIWWHARGAVRAIGVAAALALAALVADSVLFYPGRVLAGAETRAGTQASCLMIGASLQPPQTRDDLMAMTIPKAKAGPSALLLRVGEGETARRYRWSFKGMQFTRTPETFPAGACVPHRDPLIPKN